MKGENFRFLVIRFSPFAFHYLDLSLGFFLFLAVFVVKLQSRRVV